MFTDAHLMQGQEGTAIGATEALDAGDYLTTTHRPHGHILGMGIEPKRVMAEIGGRETGISGGRGGEMHMFEPSQGIIGSNGIVGASLPHAAGAALASKLDGDDAVAIAFFGDGASNQGIVHETMNLAAVWELPVLFLVENNGYAVTLPVEESSGPEQLADRAAGYGMPGKTIEGQDVLTVYQEVSDSIESIRSGDGPQFIEAETYRYLDHTASLTGMFDYRSEEEEERWHERDPVPNFRERLLDADIFDADEIESIEATETERVEESVEFMEESELPPGEDAATGFYQDEEYDGIYQPRYR
ncbi:MAG: thiamine pyrophosphate-dependent dehydrogenase E1 component subunit alpha [Halolamina sp.]|uniref:thiamine pyrophosphate-dependent dehydrogenase E1 component subunit alpha n=1 Tax=Halolamina sp. TaxID=1940283 RepID=UPI002FC2E657